MNRDNRIKLLTKVAKTGRKPESLKGKKTIKEVTKMLANLKREWVKVSEELSSAKSQKDELENFISSCSERESEIKENMQLCYSAIQNADFSGALSINFSKDDILYSVDKSCKGPWGRFDSSTYGLSFRKGPEPVDDDDDDYVSDVSDVSDAFDHNVKDVTKDVDVTVTENEGTEVEVASKVVDLANANFERKNRGY